MRLTHATQLAPFYWQLVASAQTDTSAHALQIPPSKPQSFESRQLASKTHMLLLQVVLGRQLLVQAASDAA